MVSYARPSDLVVFGGASDALTDISIVQQQAALDAASVLADGYLRAKFTLPISTPSTDLKMAVCQIAYYTLLSSRGYNPETGSDSNIRSRYQDAIAWLKGVAKGDITPELTDSSPGGILGGPFAVQSTITAGADGRPVVSAGTPSARGW